MGTQQYKWVESRYYNGDVGLGWWVVVGGLHLNNVGGCYKVIKCNTCIRKLGEDLVQARTSTSQCQPGIWTVTLKKGNCFTLRELGTLRFLLKTITWTGSGSAQAGGYFLWTNTAENSERQFQSWKQSHFRWRQLEVETIRVSTRKCLFGFHQCCNEASKFFILLKIRL